jgi:hypothetical protein
MTLSIQRLQFLLSQQPEFQSRLAIALSVVALQVVSETGVGATHIQRANYAGTVLRNPQSAAQAAALVLAQSTNVRNTITMEDEGPRTSVTDAALENQVATLWNALAGIDMGN